MGDLKSRNSRRVAVVGPRDYTVASTVAFLAIANIGYDAKATLVTTPGLAFSDAVKEVADANGWQYEEVAGGLQKLIKGCDSVLLVRMIGQKWNELEEEIEAELPCVKVTLMSAGIGIGKRKDKPRPEKKEKEEVIKPAPGPGLKRKKTFK